MQPEVLVGVREISEYLRRGPRVVRRMIKEGLPVTLEEGAYMTTTDALRAWLNERATQKAIERTRKDI